MKIIFKYGLLVGVVVFIYIMLELVLGLHGKYLSIGHYTGYLRYLLLAAGIYVGTNDLRYEQPGTDITFWTALGKGLGISAVASVIICISEWLYIDFINPKFVQDFTEFTINKLKAANASAERIAAVLEQAQIWKPMRMQMLLYFAETMILGFIFSFEKSSPAPLWGTFEITNLSASTVYSRRRSTRSRDYSWRRACPTKMISKPSSRSSKAS